jgi:hypothetical protein
MSAALLSNEPAPGVYVETIGFSEGIAGPGGELNHFLVRVVVDPGAALPEASNVSSALIHVDSGRVRVEPSAGEEIWVNVGRGEPITSSEGTLVCESGQCFLDPGQEIILAPQNSISLWQGSFTMQALDDEPAVLGIAALLRDDDFLCWICPTGPRH